MKIIISPAKLLDFKNKAPINSYTECQFLDKSEELNEQLRKLSARELSKLMKISNDLGQLNYERNQDWQRQFSIENAKQAVYAFAGPVYKGIDAYSIKEDKILDLQNKLRILSGLYGILKPLDLILPYRLEMGTKLETKNANNLYEFWGDLLVDTLNKEMKSDEILVNLASNEYSKVIPKKKLKAKLVTIVFKELKGDKYKVIVIYTKKARGLMTRYIVENNIETIEGLKGFNMEGYAFSDSLSSKNELVFTR